MSMVRHSSYWFWSPTSFPCMFSVTRDPYIVFFSNIFAILGLRSMFFLLVNVLDKFKYLETGLAFLMVFIGAKMLLHDWLETTTHSLRSEERRVGNECGSWW